jgi:hypothetical protein
MRSGFMPCRDIFEAAAFLAEAILDRNFKFSKNNSLESTGLRPIFSISCTATRFLSKSV